MGATNKSLLIMVAVVALGVGAFVNSASTKSIVDSNILLQAQLLQSDGSTEQEGSIDKDLQKLNLVNFWASWCAPCRHEMPIFQAMSQLHAQDGFQVIGIAIDSPQKTRSMLDSMGITYPIYYAEQTGMELMDRLGNDGGFLPYSLLIDQQGKVLLQKLGPVKEQDISQWVQQYLN